MSYAGQRQGVLGEFFMRKTTTVKKTGVERELVLTTKESTTDGLFFLAR